MSEYEPGTVATATVRGVPNVRVFRSRNSTRGHQWFSSDPVQGDFWFSSDPVQGDFWHEDRVVTDVRPLVVLDLDAANVLIGAHKVAETACRTLRASEFLSDSALADQIEAQTRPPKPPEPQGLGAVVEDERGHRFVRTLAPCLPWIDADDLDNGYEYRTIAAVKVLSEGVQP